MNAYINECIMGEYDHVGASILYSDTDSVAGDSVIHTSLGEKTIEELFLNGSKFWKDGDKEYSVNPSIEVAIYDKTQSGPVKLGSYNYVYRHKTNKRRFRLTDNLGNQVIVTEDHSVIISDNGELIEKKPAEVKKGDKILTIRHK
jgi:intein/homing endonuclease